MPEIDGYEATTEIRKYEIENNLKITPIIFVSSFSDIDHINKAFSVGGFEYINKPVQLK